MGKAITLKEIAKVVDYSLSMVSKYENGCRDMTSDRIKLYREYITNK